MARTSRKRWRLSPREMRTSFGVCLGVGVLLLATGCTAEVNGVAGVSVDERGGAIAVVVACQGKFDGATLEDLTEPATITIVREWSFDASKTRRWDIVESPTATNPKPRGALVLKPSVAYHLTASSRDEQTTSGSITFTAVDLARLRPGQIRYFQENASGGTGRYVVVNAAEFESLACR